MSSEGKAPEAVAATTGAVGGTPQSATAAEGHPTSIMDKYAPTTPYQKRFASAMRWRIRNRDAWEYMVGLANERVKANSAFGMQELVEQVRRRDFTDRHGMPTRVNNTLVPALARLLVAKHPECHPLVEFRTHAYDGLVGVTDR